MSGRWIVPPEIENRIRGRPLLLLTDYDGTLVPIRDQPEQAVLGRCARELRRAESLLGDLALPAIPGRVRRGPEPRAAGGAGVHHGQPVPVSVLQGKKVVEVRAAEASKGHFVRWLLHTYPLAEEETIVALGADETDEEMFRALPGAALTVKVGPGDTSARFRIERQDELIDFLAKIGVLTSILGRTNQNS